MSDLPESDALSLPKGWVETEFGLLPKAWEPVEAQQFCKKVADGTHDSPKQQETGKLLITSKNIKDSRLDVASAYHISNDDFNEVNRRSKVDQWDVLLSMIGTVGEVCLIDSEPDFAIKNVGLFKCGNEIKGKWLYYFLKSKGGQHYIFSRLSGTTQKYITLGELRKLPVPTPPLPEQKAIADMLSSFDEKIELLREQNKTLETLAQTIFKEWFVNFNYPDATGDMVDSELGEIPKGWRVGDIEDVFDFMEGPGIRNWQYTESGTRFMNIRLIQNGDILVCNSNFVSDEEANGKYKHFHLQEKDFVLSTSGTLGRGAIVRKEHLPIILNTSVIRFRPKDEKSYGFLYQFLQSRYFLHELQSLASGSVQLNFGPMHLRKIRFIIPNTDALDVFAKASSPIYEKMASNLSHIQTLSKTRDTLLPKLMSGQVRVRC